MDTFEKIYEQNLWGGAESKSGPGSSMASTELLRKELAKLLLEYKLHRILDVPCGDFNWMSSVVTKDNLYIGGDIVGALVELNNKTFQSKRVKFVVMDLRKDDLPKSDVLIVRDCFVHMSFDDIWSCLKNIVRHSIPYVLMTSFVDLKANVDRPTGQWRPLNMGEAPFGLKNPVATISERTKEDKYCDKSMMLYKMADIRKCLTQS